MNDNGILKTLRTDHDGVTTMNTLNTRRQEPLIGKQLGRMYEGRKELRRTVPLFLLSWRDVVNSFKGLAAGEAAASQGFAGSLTAPHAPGAEAAHTPASAHAPESAHARA